MGQVLPEAAQDRDLQRSITLALAGFSFTAVAGLALLDPATRPLLQLAVWYVLSSFIAYLGALNIHAYKATRFQNHLAVGLLEVGSLSLLLTLVSLVWSASFQEDFKWLATLLALGPWLIDHLVRLRIDHKYLAELDTAKRSGVKR